MVKNVTVQLFRPDGGTSREWVGVEVTHYNKDIIEFQLRVEEGDNVTVTDYTSNLPYLIIEAVTGPKSLL